MAGYCSPAYVVALLSTDLINSGTNPEQSAAGLQTHIDAAGAEAQQLWWDQFGSIPDEPASPLFPDEDADDPTAIQLVLETFSAFRACEAFTHAKSQDVNDSLSLQSETFKRLADFISDGIRSGYLDNLVLQEPIAITPLCSVADCSLDSSGFTASTDPDNGPIQIVVERLIAAYSVITRCRALERSAAAFADSLTTLEAQVYRDITRRAPGGLIAMLRRTNTEYGASLNREVNAKIGAYYERIARMDQGKDDAAILIAA